MSYLLLARAKRGVSGESAKHHIIDKSAERLSIFPLKLNGEKRSLLLYTIISICLQRFSLIPSKTFASVEDDNEDSEKRLFYFSEQIRTKTQPAKGSNFW